MFLILAPMEGVLDDILRDLLTRIGGIDRCVTEFVRITDQKLPARVFHRLAPELQRGGTTASGTPVFVQLLGGNPEMMACNAEIAAKLGAPGIDINFGCPAKLVNRNDGGAALLKEPARIQSVVSAVRAAVPPAIPVTAKIRLGFDDESLLHELVDAAYKGGASELAIHARTRRDGYKPPARWHALHPIERHPAIPLIVNGDIRCIRSFQNSRTDSGCEHIMIGRGLLCRPSLAQEIKHHLNGDSYAPLEWAELSDQLLDLLATTEQRYPIKFVGNRVKQWLHYLRQNYPQAALLFEQIKRYKGATEIREAIIASRSAA